jgi:aromatic ring-cleaving dioxygenase
MLFVPFCEDDVLSELPAAQAEIARISSYHAHIYYRTPEERAKAEKLRADISERFAVAMGRWQDMPVGPHAAPMYQVAFAKALFAAFVPWLMLNRNGLAILLHPNSGAPRGDHQVHPIWFGEILPIIRPEQLPETGDEDETVTPNTVPAI